MTADERRSRTPAADQLALDGARPTLHNISNTGARRIRARNRSPQLLTVEQAADRLNTTVRFIRRLVAERRIAFTKLGRHVRIDTADLDEFIAGGRVESCRQHE